MPPIVVKDELDSGELKLVAELPGIFARFQAHDLHYSKVLFRP